MATELASSAAATQQLPGATQKQQKPSPQSPHQPQAAPPLRVLITGASEGIGAAVARRFASAAAAATNANATSGGAGVRLALLSRSREKLQALVASLPQPAAAAGAAGAGEGAGAEGSGGAGGGHVVLPADLRDTAALRGVVAQAVEQLGGLDVVVHNGAPGDLDPRDILNPDTWRTQLDLHVLSAVAIAGAAQEALAASPRGGVLLCVSSICGQAPMPAFAAYCAAKAAQDMLVRTLAVAWGGSGIRVLSVAPGPIHTPGLERYAEHVGRKASGATDRDAAVVEGLKVVGSRQPLGRVGTPEEVAAAIHFLTTPEAGFVTGVVLPIDGGALAYSAWGGGSSGSSGRSSLTSAQQGKTRDGSARGVEAPAGAGEVEA
ncbi:hypothetical protein HYH02_005055 [Chlamydomonas schloesseri]|uniref:Uncharacterized protein n=1 Tax=Chlamydomonas schloesseri TaxID=2026947 RepID=A0A835WMJ7_9CHLO|nr:hypothetical protein HYH02_005055 [Chlamydomonas schloesseri]|eukprot:KAG2450554.1 hypothetical protein HYH02_005055 [Chlamydomonas schloesseri]